MRKGFQIITRNENGQVPIIHTKRSWIILNLPGYRGGSIYILKKTVHKTHHGFPSEVIYSFVHVNASSEFMNSYLQYAQNFYARFEQISIQEAIEFMYRHQNDSRYCGTLIQFFDYRSLCDWLDKHYPVLCPENRPIPNRLLGW